MRVTSYLLNGDNRFCSGGGGVKMGMRMGGSAAERVCFIILVLLSSLSVATPPSYGLTCGVQMSTIFMHLIIF